MDVTSFGFYGLVCGALAGLAPYLGALWVRLMSGAVVGVASAWALPLLKTMMGPY